MVWIGARWEETRDFVRNSELPKGSLDGFIFKLTSSGWGMQGGGGIKGLLICKGEDDFDRRQRQQQQRLRRQQLNYNDNNNNNNNDPTTTRRQLQRQQPYDNNNNGGNYNDSALLQGEWKQSIAHDLLRIYNSDDWKIVSLVYTQNLVAISLLCTV
jgi:hypothetical protein